MASATLLIVVAYVSWTCFSSTMDAVQAEIHPVKVPGKIFQQLSYAPAISKWNIPFFDITQWMLWFTGIVATGFLCISRARINTCLSSAGIITVAFSAGFVVVGLFQLILGLTGFARFPLIYVSPLPLLITILWSRPRTLILQCLKAVHWNWRHSSHVTRLTLLLFALILGILALPALTPPVQSDGVRYHLGAVQEYIKAGRITYLSLNAYSNMPFLIEMHFMSALACGAPVAAQLMHFTLAIFTALGLYSISQFLSPKLPHIVQPLYFIPSLLYLSIPVSAVVAGWPFTDHGISCFLVVALYFALALRSNPASCCASYAVFGMILGGLMGTKYTMLPSALILAFIPFLSPCRRWHLLPVVSATSAVTGGIWLVKNYAYTGNPFYPLLSGIFPGGEWTPETNAFLHDKAGAKGIPPTLPNLLTSPVQLTLNWLRFEQHNPGIILLAAMPGIIYSMIRKSTPGIRFNLWIILSLALFNYLVWFFSYQSNRLLLPVLALLLPLVPLSPLCAPRPARLLYPSSLIFASLLGLGWAFQWAFVTTGLTPPPLTYLTGQISESRYRYASLSYARAYDYLNDKVSPDSKVLMIGEHRIYGARFPAVWSDWFDQPAITHIIRQNNISDVHQLLKYLKQNHISWVMVNDHEISLQSEIFRSRFTTPEWEIYQQLIAPAMDKYLEATISPGVRIYDLEKTQQ